MATESDSDDRSDEPIDLAAHAVATSGPETPEEVLGTLLGEDLGPDAVADAFLERGVTMSLDDYLGYDEATRHELRFDDLVEYLPCVADTLIAAELLDDERVTVRSRDPVTDHPVTFEITRDSTDVSPEEAVVSVGMAAEVPKSETMTDLTLTACTGGELPDGRTPDELPDLVCAYINAFESVTTYEQWVTDVDSTSVALPAAALLPGIRQFVASPAFD